MSHGAGLGVFIVICHTCFCFSFGLGACWEETFLSAFFFLDPTQFYSRDELQSLWKSWFEKDLLMFDDIQIPKIHIYIIWRDRLCCVDRSAKSFGCTYLMMMIIIIIGIFHYSLLMFGSLLLHVQCSSCFPEVLTQFRQQWSCLKATPLPKIVFDEHTIWCSTITPSSTYIIFSYIYTHTSILTVHRFHIHNKRRFYVPLCTSCIYHDNVFADHKPAIIISSCQGVAGFIVASDVCRYP